MSASCKTKTATLVNITLWAWLHRDVSILEPHRAAGVAADFSSCFKMIKNLPLGTRGTEGTGEQISAADLWNVSTDEAQCGLSPGRWTNTNHCHTHDCQDLHQPFLWENKGVWTFLPLAWVCQIASAIPHRAGTTKKTASWSGRGLQNNRAMIQQKLASAAEKRTDMHLLFACCVSTYCIIILVKASSTAQ